MCSPRDHRNGQSGAKKIGVRAIITHGNSPIWNNAAVMAWNTTTATYAHGRERRHSSQPTIVRSNAAPAQLRAIATFGSSSQAPISGRSVRAASQIRIGCPCSSQSALSLANPAKT